MRQQYVLSVGVYEVEETSLTCIECWCILYVLNSIVYDVEETSTICIECWSIIDV